MAERTPKDKLHPTFRISPDARPDAPDGEKPSADSPPTMVEALQMSASDDPKTQAEGGKLIDAPRPAQPFAPDELPAGTQVAPEAPDTPIAMGETGPTTPPPPIVTLATREGAEHMATAIDDGRPILLYPVEGDPVQAYRRKTRSFEGGVWVERSVWSLWRGSNPVPFEPVGWAKVEN